MSEKTVKAAEGSGGKGKGVKKGGGENANTQKK